MTRRMMLLTLGLLGVSARLWAQETQGRRIVGDVVLVRSTRLHVKSIGDRSYTVRLTESTRIRRGDKVVPADDIRVGERVVIDVGTGAEPLVAKEVVMAPRHD